MYLLDILPLYNYNDFNLKANVSVYEETDNTSKVTFQ